VRFFWLIFLAKLPHFATTPQSLCRPNSRRGNAATTLTKSPRSAGLNGRKGAKPEAPRLKHGLPLSADNSHSGCLARIGKSRACRDREDAVCSGRQRALLGRQLQAVADPELGQDVSRTGRIGFDLLPQPANEHPKILHFLGLCRAPHLA
jgi:hypothetical protein